MLWNKNSIMPLSHPSWSEQCVRTQDCKKIVLVYKFHKTHGQSYTSAFSPSRDALKKKVSPSPVCAFVCKIVTLYLKANKSKNIRNYVFMMCTRYILSHLLYIIIMKCVPVQCKKDINSFTSIQIRIIPLYLKLRTLEEPNNRQWAISN